MRRIKNHNLNTNEYWDSLATDAYAQKDAVRGGNICKFNTIRDLLPPSSDILDVGCLNGNLYSFLKNNSFALKSFAGVDLSNKQIELARSRFPEQTWLQSDCYKLQFPDKNFDAVTILEVLEHVDNPRAAIKEAARVCRDGGMLIVSVPNELKIEDSTHVWSFTTTDLFELLSEFSTNVQILQTCSNNRNIVGKVIINFTTYF